MSDQTPGPLHTGNDINRIRQRARMRQMAEAGFSRTRTAEALGISRATVQRFAKSSGVRFQQHRARSSQQDIPQPPVETDDIAILDPDDYREAIQDMKPIAAVDHLLGLLDGLTHQLPEMSLTPLPGLILTRLEARLLYHLDRHRGRPVTQEALMFAMYQIRPYDDWPDVSIVNVRLCRLRQKLGDPEVPGLRIETCRGVGFCLRVDTGVTLDWHAAPPTGAST
ncbi:winged helix-turn-helix domain-containing protein [Roseisalinus antarcticus]|uniref:Alkaline phosphatase synthesis transcriptional regulatory protein PhoP n=1 Tax=Roseisalinus antarcticus TaxID=254357 RepID=A0A1Y5U1X2_9RHOB|nr:winged helix-turn-helix domain-containing protein [Roseisalinus antarcticus]SLN77032.1 Alkaline phosphatase synthesis transcriptional regulatory protein PhoP [Roseisalinus antarcticus]